MNIRKISTKDIEPLLLLGEKAHEEGGFSSIEYDHVKVSRLLALCITTPERFFCAVAEAAGGVIAGVQLSVVNSYWMGHDTIAEELLLYVLPEYRKSTSTGYRLTQTFVSWAEAVGAREVVAGTTLGIDTEGVKVFYERQGFASVGYVFKKRV